MNGTAQPLVGDNWSTRMDPRALRRHLLLVDDHRTTRDALGSFLALEGWEVETAEDGAEALARIAEGERPDVIVTDYMMPRLDGLTMLARLRGDPALPHPPAVMMSAGALPQGALEQVEAFLAKPIDLQQLQEALRRLIH